MDTESPLDPAANDPHALQRMKHDVANEVAGLLNDPAFRSTLASSFAAGQDRAKLADALAAHHQGTVGTAESRAAARRIALLDREMRAAKGIEAYSSSLLEVRLIRSGGTAIDWATIPVAFLPARDEEEWTEIEAFDPAGSRIVLDPENPPDMPILVAGIDSAEDLRAGIAYMNDELARHGLGVASDFLFAATSIETSKLDYIRLNDDEEPWISGDAEIYALVSGVDPDASHVQIQAVEMPYLNGDGTDYHPNQILVFWDTYRFAAANVQIFEHDDSTNYQSLVQALISAVERVLNLAAPEFAIIATIANEILAAMPGEWFANDDDYVDSYYTLEKGRTYTNRRGAGGNARITLVPYILQGN